VKNIVSRLSPHIFLSPHTRPSTSTTNMRHRFCMQVAASAAQLPSWARIRASPHVTKAVRPKRPSVLRRVILEAGPDPQVCGASRPKAPSV
jgi:hypothetical protein